MNIFPFFFINRSSTDENRTSSARLACTAEPPFEVNHQQGIRVSESSNAIDTLDDQRLQRFAQLLSDTHTPLLDISLERTKVLMGAPENERPALSMQMCEMAADFYATVKERRRLQRYYHGPRLPRGLAEAITFLGDGLKQNTLTGEEIGRLKREVWKFGGTEETTNEICFAASA